MKTATNKYLYIFSYQTPEQMTSMAHDGDPEESSAAVFIEAESPDQALTWGREISYKYVRQLFGDRLVDWKASNFAHWVECEPHKEYPAAILEKLPVVASGDYPDFESLKR